MTQKKRLSLKGTEMNPAESLKCILESNQWNNQTIDQMKLEDKDVFLVIGPSRAGKGTLLASILGHKMKFFKRNKVKDTAVGKNIQVAHFMAPVDKDGVTPLENQIVSHSHNSHTLKPKIVGNAKYPAEYSQLDGTFLIDFPGIFESKGVELDIASHLALQRIMLKAKSVKVLVLVAAPSFSPDLNQIIELILDELNLMFAEPEKHLVIGITKARIASDIIDESEILDWATGRVGEESVHRSFKGYTCIQVEQDDTKMIQDMI